VIIGAGVAPTTEFLKGAFPLEKDGSLVTDEFLAVQGAPDVFAAGRFKCWRDGYHAPITRTLTSPILTGRAHALAR